MFAKPFRVKSSSQMKGSDKKKFKADVRKRFEYFSRPDVDMDALNDLIPNKEELIATKVETNSGEHVVLYQRQQLTLFFEHEKDRVLFPSLYTLWQFPDILPAFPTHRPVVQKLANGADLMLPGVVVDERLGVKAYNDGKVKKNDIMAVNLVDNKAGVAIGKAALDSEDMYMSGKRGKAIIIVHCVGDHLWINDGKKPLPELGPPSGLDFVNEDENDDGCDENGSANADVVSDEQAGDFDDGDQNAGDENAGDENAGDEKAGDENASEESAEVDMDEMLETAFLRACKTSARKVELPVLSSNFFSCHVLPACPPGCPALSLKKTRYKKVSRFLAEKQSEGLVTLREARKGVEAIAAINYEHEKIANFRVVKYDVDEEEGKEKEAAGFAAPVITELNIVTGNEVAAFFRAVKKPKGCGLTTADVRECVRQYVADNGLQNAADKTLVTLDPVLADAVLVKGENNVLTFKWEKLHSRITSKMSKGVSVQFAGQPPVIQRGKLDLIEMLIGSRSGNKKVTLVHNLDVFGIKPAEFAHKCQVGVAASCSVHEAPNKKKSNGSPVVEVLVQGNQVAFVSKLLLEDYQIPRKYIRGLELAAKAKGKKK